MTHPLAQLEHLSLGVMAKVLLDTQAVPLDTWRGADALNQHLRTAPRHAWIVRRWLAALSRAGWLQNKDDQLAFHAVPEAPQLEQLPALGFPASMASLHERVISQLPELLRDEVALAALLLEAGDPVAVLGAYQHNHYTAAINEALAARARELPIGNQPLRVLELGGGAGCATRAVLAALQERAVAYCFSDISPLFKHAAQRQWRLEPGMTFALLDMDHNLAGQGVEARSQDLVIAANVLHNARDALHTLTHIRACLRPGGTLLFSESIADNPAMLTFMHLLLSPASGAPLCAYDEVFLAPEHWRPLLRVAGFELLEVWPTADQPLADAGQRLFHAVERAQ
ncbi:MAG: Polyketide synthase PksM [Pseudomonas fluorescens]|nr:MAG: Polyketide synthase PksM [Pseudomonas fluorescens]